MTGEPPAACPMPGCPWTPVAGHRYPRAALLHHIRTGHTLTEVVDRLEDAARTSWALSLVQQGLEQTRRTGTGTGNAGHQ